MRIHNRKRAVRAAAAISALALCLAVGPAQGARLSEQKPPSPGAPDARPPEIEMDGALVTRLAESRGALGAYYDPATDQHVLVAPRSGPGSEITEAHLRELGVNGRLARSNLTRAIVDGFQASVAQQARADSGRNSFSSYLDLRREIMVLETDAPDNVVGSLTSNFPGRIEVRRTSVNDAFSRTDDIAPFWGGAGITSAGPICSAGFPVTSAWGSRFMVTAGHCFALGGTVLTESGSNTMGIVVDRDLFPPFDLELISGSSYDSSVYVGPVVTSASKRISSGADPVVGVNGYCFSGRTSGERCNQTTDSITAQVCTASGCKSPVIRFSGGGAPQGGDSGSPFYFVGSVPGIVFIRGMVIATNGISGYAHRYTTISGHYGMTTP